MIKMTLNQLIQRQSTLIVGIIFSEKCRYILDEPFKKNNDLNLDSIKIAFKKEQEQDCSVFVNINEYNQFLSKIGKENAS